MPPNLCADQPLAMVGHPTLLFLIKLQQITFLCLQHIYQAGWLLGAIIGYRYPLEQGIAYYLSF